MSVLTAPKEEAMMHHAAGVTNEGILVVRFIIQMFADYDIKC